MKKIAFITGVSGQDGSYLTEFLLQKGYEVHGLVRRTSENKYKRLEHLIHDIHITGNNFYLHYGDMTDSSNLIRLLQEIQPDEIYNLAAQSHVRVSFDVPEFTADTDALGTLRILEAIRILKMEDKVKFYQASTSELYGEVQEVPQTEDTPFYPRSPYAVAKLYAYWIVKNYREAYNIFGVNGILFNHESPRRGDTFVTKKITKTVKDIKEGKVDKLYLGNIDSKRDWGHAREYVECMWKMLQTDTPEDYVIATGETHTVREFVEESFKYIDIYIRWEGEGINEKGIDSKTGKVIVEIDPYYFRPTEVDLLIGDASKAKEKLGWEPQIKFKDLVKVMMESEFNEEPKDIYLNKQL